ncbi:ATP-grasp domain-containing protein [Sediminibacillus albus]|uniref:Ribosomal protein S6--L-glutamate ligase/gamma-F420-2:alpha-L-glutamate ligase n=1 Tax=Sediminibacillus albus TaxID=407036 RepID=A0A1G9BNY9_9BACI|nr:RimK family alpha-L-glutamate ligase [Sediminibacillus albus]SDK41166.1 ribosomal protein S6--L-glutamate ligase/gamma-F420-2:alpha-L-glutamate ligase [Sediminibacillus albus]
MVKFGWVIYNGHLPGNKFKDFAEWIQEAAAKRDINMSIIKNNHLIPTLSQEGGTITSLSGGPKPDFVVFGDKDILLAKQLELTGIPVFNSAEAIAVSDDKAAAYQILANEKLPIPETLISPKVFPGSTAIEQDSFLQAGKILDFPLIIKESFGSFGEQVYLVHSSGEMLEKIKEIGDKPFVLQKFISSSFGKDLRLNVVGSKVVAAMKRTSHSDFRANVSAGGEMESYQPNSEESQLAIEATKAIGADFAGVDLLFGPENKPLICEVNSNAHIKNIYNCTKINVADHIIDYIIDKLSK